MNENTVSSVSKVELDYGSSSPAGGVRSNPAVEGSQAAEVRQAQQKPAQSEASKPVAPTQSQMPNMALRFKVNEETNDVTVYVVDRASNRVVRTIPPEEVNHLKAGDLLELLA